MKNGWSNPPAPGSRCAGPPGGLLSRPGGSFFSPHLTIPSLAGSHWESMRVALVTEFYYPHLGGVTEHVHNLGLELGRRGHDVTILTSNMRGQTPDPPGVRRIGTSRVIYSNGAFARITTGWRLPSQIEATLRDIAADVVHVQDGLAPVLGPVAAGAAHRLDIPVVATFHSWFPRSLGCRVFRRPLQRRLDRLAATIAVSEPVVQALSRYFTARWEVIANGVDVELFHPNGRRPADAQTHGPRLLFLGRLDPRNGLDTVLSAMPRILARYPATELVVAGDGPLRGWYERAARPLGRAVHFIGRVNGDRPERYGDADLYLCPTTKASFGITLLEAMACGIPLLASDITGFRELVGDGQAAVLIPRDDPDAWATATLALLDDPGRRALMGRAGRAKAAGFAWPRITDRIVAVYERVRK